MSTKDRDKIMLAEHILEVRHLASGSFLDVRGYVADYIRNSKLFPHWKINTNVVNFHDEANGIKLEGAFAGYKSAGYVAYNPPTRNYFIDKATSYWKTLKANTHYQIPEVKRFGTRTKIFMPIKKSFDEINKAMYENFYTENARNLIGGKETDAQFIIELAEDQFNVRVSGGPIHEDEVSNYFSFTAGEFKNCGIFLDLDYYKDKELSSLDITVLLKKAVELTWVKAEKITSGLGF